MSPARTRLDPATRREQLLEIGARLFAERPFEEVSIEELARLAGVSRGLMYRYFATKRDLFRAIVQEAADRLVDLSAPEGDSPLEQRLAAALDAYLATFEKNATLVRAAYTAAAAADDEVRAIIAAKARGHEDNIMSVLVGLGAEETPKLRVAVRGWIFMCRMLMLDWLDTREISRDELREVCQGALNALIDDAVASSAARGR